MKINGEFILLENNMNLRDFLIERGYDFTKVAVEINGNIAKKAEFANINLNNNDVIEVVSFVGGG